MRDLDEYLYRNVCKHLDTLHIYLHELRLLKSAKEWMHRDGKYKCLLCYGDYTTKVKKCVSCKKDLVVHKNIFLKVLIHDFKKSSKKYWNNSYHYLGILEDSEIMENGKIIILRE